jgi:hypothetical protein
VERAEYFLELSCEPCVGIDHTVPVQRIEGIDLARTEDQELHGRRDTLDRKTMRGQEIVATEAGCDQEPV